MADVIMTAVQEFWKRHPEKIKCLPTVEDMVAEGLLDLADPRINPIKEDEATSHPSFFGPDDDDACGWFI